MLNEHKNSGNEDVISLSRQNASMKLFLETWLVPLLDNGNPHVSSDNRLRQKSNAQVRTTPPMPESLPSPLVVSPLTKRLQQTKPFEFFKKRRKCTTVTLNKSDSQTHQENAQRPTSCTLHGEFKREDCEQCQHFSNVWNVLNMRMKSLVLTNCLTI